MIAERIQLIRSERVRDRKMKVHGQDQKPQLCPENRKLRHERRDACEERGRAVVRGVHVQVAIQKANPQELDHVQELEEALVNCQCCEK